MSKITGPRAEFGLTEKATDLKVLAKRIVDDKELGPLKFESHTECAEK